MIKNLGIPSPSTYTEIFRDIDSKNENEGMKSMSLKSDIKSQTSIEFLTIYVLLKPGSMRPRVPVAYMLNLVAWLFIQRSTIYSQLQIKPLNLVNHSKTSHETLTKPIKSVDLKFIHKTSPSLLSSL